MNEQIGNESGKRSERFSVVNRQSSVQLLNEDRTMKNNGIKRPMLSRVLAGTVLVGSLAFAAQADAQQNGTGQAGQAGQARAEGRGGRGGPRLAPEQMVERRVSRLTAELALNASQSESIRRILVAEHAQMEALRPEGGPRRVPGDSAARGERRQRPDSAAMAQNRAQMEALRQQTDARIERVLTSDQVGKYRGLVKNRPEGARGGRGPGGRGGNRQAPPPAK